MKFQSSVHHILIGFSCRTYKKIGKEYVCLERGCWEVKSGRLLAKELNKVVELSTTANKTRCGRALLLHTLLQMKGC